MILNNSNWQPSITRSVRGNSSYKFQNQVFGSDVDKLKVEIVLAGKPINQVQILPCTLTVSYAENIDDEVFVIPLGLAKPLATIVGNLKPYSFTISLTNPNATPIIGTVKKPTIRQTTSPSIPTMSNVINPHGSDPALLAATLANAVAIGTLSATMSAQPNMIADAIANNGMIIEYFENTQILQTWTMVKATDTTHQAVTVTNWSLNKVKVISVSGGVPTGTYAASTSEFVLSPAVLVGTELVVGGTCTFDDKDSKGAIYCIASGAQSAKGVAMKVSRTA